jgi:calcium-dependent protein kinase
LSGSKDGSKDAIDLIGMGNDLVSMGCAASELNPNSCGCIRETTDRAILLSAGTWPLGESGSDSIAGAAMPGIGIEKENVCDGLEKAPPFFSEASKEGKPQRQRRHTIGAAGMPRSLHLGGGRRKSTTIADYTEKSKGLLRKSSTVDLAVFFDDRIASHETDASEGSEKNSDGLSRKQDMDELAQDIIETSRSLVPQISMDDSCIPEPDSPRRRKMRVTFASTKSVSCAEVGEPRRASDGDEDGKNTTNQQPGKVKKGVSYERRMWKINRNSVLGRKEKPSRALQLMIENPRDIRHVYDFKKGLIGSGSFGTVKKTRVKVTGAIRAVKTISKTDIRDGVSMLRAEVKITKLVDHPCIVKLYEIFEDDQYIHLVMELCSGGTVMQKINELGICNEAQAIHMMRQLIRSVLYLHNQLICHRDLKPENLLIYEAGPWEKTSLKVTDFGVSCQFQPKQVLKARVGTVAYMSPQVIEKEYDERCDIWSCGVIMYFLFSGDVPFQGKDTDERYKKICAGRFAQSAGLLDASEEALAVLNGLLKVDVDKRLTCRDALAHKWFSRHFKEVEFPMSLLHIFSSLCLFKDQSKFIRASFCLVASLLSPEHLRASDAAFRILDRDGDGIVTAVDMKDKLRAMLAKKDISEKDGKIAQKSLDEVESKLLENYTYTEFLAATFDRQKYLQDGVLKAAFTAFDQDCNGFVTLEELAEGSLLGNLKVSELVKLVNQCDTNGDGEIEFNEYRKMMRRAI